MPHHIAQNLQVMPLDLLHESPSNPRRHWPTTAMNELTKSVQQVGILTPLLVRTNSKGYEIAAGHRRFRAAKAAGLTEVPVIVRGMTDEEFLEVMTVENLHREDIHPLDEAASYHSLLSTLHIDVPTLSAKVEKSESYIYGRLKLLDLIKSAQEAFLKDDIAVGHAILIARLQPADQARVMKECVTMLSDEFPLRTSGPKGMISVKHLEAFIRTEIMLDLHKAPFKKEDQDLVPKAGSCTTCEKRTGYNQSLFHDIEKSDLCTDGRCFNAKMDAFVRIQEETLTEKGESVMRIVEGWHDPDELKKLGNVVSSNDLQKVSKRTPPKGVTKDKIHMGLVVSGPNRGQSFPVVLNKDHAHRHDWRSPAEVERDRKKNREEKLKQAILDAQFKAVTDRLQEWEPNVKEPQAWLLVAKHMWHRCCHDAKKKYCKLRGIGPKEVRRSFGGHYRDYDGTVEALLEKMTSSQLFGFLMQVSLAEDLPFGDKKASAKLKTVAGWTGVKLDAIEKEVKAVAQPKKKQENKKIKQSKKATTTI